jgi:hypothetical protein
MTRSGSSHAARTKKSRMKYTAAFGSTIFRLSEEDFVEVASYRCGTGTTSTLQTSLVTN